MSVEKLLSLSPAYQGFKAVKDGKIPHFGKSAVEELIKESRLRSGRKGHLSLMLRDLGGLIRADNLRSLSFRKLCAH